MTPTERADLAEHHLASLAQQLTGLLAEYPSDILPVVRHALEAMLRQCQETLSAHRAPTPAPTRPRWEYRVTTQTKGGDYFPGTTAEVEALAVEGQAGWHLLHVLSYEWHPVIVYYWGREL